jgi:bacterial/archaeal transporter family protein
MQIARGLKAKWFWYSLLAVLFWGAWVLCSKLGTNEIPASTMQFIFAFGFIPVAILVLVMKRVKFERSVKGISFSLGNGVLAGIGGLTLFAAYRSGGNTSVITAATALYPLITVVLAVLVLRERLNWLQMIGLGFAAAAIIIFSL